MRSWWLAPLASTAISSTPSPTPTTLGYALRLVIDLEPVHPFVRLRHVRFSNPGALTDAVADIVAASAFDGEPVDFLDGTVFGADDAYLTLGSWRDLDPAEPGDDSALDDGKIADIMLYVEARVS